MIARVRILFCVLSVVFSCRALCIAAVDTAGVDELIARYTGNNDKPSGNDAAVIDSFLAAAIDEMVIAGQANEMVDIRRTIVSRKDCGNRNYASAFASAAAVYLAEILKEFATWQPGQRTDDAQLNVAILIAQLQHPAAANLAIDMLKHDNAGVRYWAVRAVTDQRVVSLLSSEFTGDAVIRGRILYSVKELIDSSVSADVLALITDFCGYVGGSDGTELLLKIADTRIQAYAAWQAMHEWVDLAILGVLGKMIPAEQSQSEKQALCRRFAQLYSYMIQRYILTEQQLSDTARLDLVSAIVEVEYSVLPQLVGNQQTGIQKAIEKKSASALKREHDLLLGTAAMAGELAGKHSFDYGKNANGIVITAPAELQPRPD